MSDLFEDVMKAKRQEVPQAVPPLQDTLAHGSIQGGKIQIVPDSGDPNNPFQALITNNDKTREYVRIGQEYKGPLTALIKSSRDIDYDVGSKGRSIKEITEFVTDKQGKPTGIVVLDSDDDELFIPMASLGRIGKEPNPEAMLKDMKDQARAEDFLDFSMNRSNDKPKTALTEELLAPFREFQQSEAFKKIEEATQKRKEEFARDEYGVGQREDLQRASSRRS